MDDRYASTLPDFDAIWDSQVIPWARANREQHSRYWRLMIVRLAVMVVLLVPGVVGIFVSEDWSLPHIFSILWSVAILVAGVIWANGPSRAQYNLEVDAKRHALGALSAAAGLEYDVEAKGFDIGAFAHFRFEPGGKRDFLMEDRIAGRHGGLSFELCEALIVGNWSDLRNDGKSSRNLLLRVDSSWNFTSETHVYPRLDSHPFENEWAGADGREPEPVYLEDPRFDEIFRVFSTDQVESRYLLTPTFMERLTALSEKMDGQRVECAFVGGKILVAIGVEKNQFEVGDILEDPFDHTVPHRLRDELSAIFRLIDAVRFPDKTRV